MWLSSSFHHEVESISLFLGWPCDLLSQREGRGGEGREKKRERGRERDDIVPVLKGLGTCALSFLKSCPATMRISLRWLAENLISGPVTHFTTTDNLLTARHCVTWSFITWPASGAVSISGPAKASGSWPRAKELPSAHQLVSSSYCFKPPRLGVLLHINS